MLLLDVIINSLKLDERKYYSLSSYMGFCFLYNFIRAIRDC